MTYDAVRRRTVLFGGANGVSFLGDTWEWDGSNWLLRSLTGSPSPRSFASGAYDTARSTFVLFGGADSFNDFDDTWEYTPTQPASYTSFGSGCPGSAGTPALTSSLLPWLNSPFTLDLALLPVPSTATILALGTSNTTWGGFPLPLDLTNAGMPGCNLLVSLDLLIPLTAAGGSATWTTMVPNDPTLTGNRLYAQGFALDPTANTLGAITSNGGDARVGAK